ncbi:MAG: FG-GAP-like repeat-containing protein [Rhizomicrobium sp.]
MAISGTPVVDGLGQFNYTIPIAAPPGTTGMVPHLALTYRSSNLDGIVGYGWTVSGLDVIARCPQGQTTYSQSGGVNYNSNDAFCFNGQPLLKTNESDVYGSGTSYDTQAASFYLIKPNGTQGGGPQWWEVHLKNGTVIQLGNTSDSRVVAAGNPNSTVREWLVNKITDVYGNYLTVTYTPDAANGEAYPSEIDYSGNDGTGGHSATAPYNSVQFKYTNSTNPRLDVTPTYEGGSVQEITVLLTDIITYNGTGASGTPVLDYHLNYRAGTTQPGQTPLHSRLTTLTLCDGGGSNCLKPMNFSWQGGTGFAGLTKTTPSQTPIFFGDFDGDGLLDIGVSGCPSGGDILRGVGPAGSFISANMTAAYDFYGPPPYFTPGSHNGDPICLGDLSQVLALDLDRDGFTDFMVQSTYDSSGDYESSILGNRKGSIYDPSFTQGGKTKPGWPSFGIIADFDNDGALDAIDQTHDNFYGYRYFGHGSGGFTHTGGDNVPGTGYDYKLIPGDFNGDGCAEMVAQASTSTSIRRFTEYCSAPSQTLVTSNCATGTLYAGDFNGDGKTDLLVVRSNGAWICLSTASGSTDIAVPFGPELPVSGSSNWSSSNYKIVIGDWNGDGKADVALIGNGTAHLIYLSTGTDFVQVQSISNSSTGITPVVQDGNNDGADDIWLLGSTNALYTSAYLPELMTGVDNGIGSTVAISYSPINTNGTFYVKGNHGADWPRIDIDGPVNVVAQIAFSNGAGTGHTNYNLGYSYTGGIGEPDLAPTGAPKSNVLTAQLEAFETIQSTDSRNGAKTTLTYDVIPTLFGFLQARDTRISGIAVSGEFYTYTGYLSPDITGGIQVLTYTKHLRDLTGADIGGTEATEYTDYDLYGNVLTSQFTKGGLTRNTDNYTPTNDKDTWILNQVLKTDLESILGTSDIVRETTFDRNPTTGFVTYAYTQPTDPDLKLTTNYHYDGFGNQNIITQSGQDVPSRHNNVDYDTGRGEFPETNTDPMGHVSTATFDVRFGTPHTVTDVNTLTTTTNYDTLGRVVSISRPDTTQIAYAYDYCGGAVVCPATGAYRVTMTPEDHSNAPIGAITMTYYDAFDRVIAADTNGFDGSIIRVSSQYDDATGQLKATSRPYFLVGGTPQWTTYVRDALYRVTQTTYPDGSHTSNCFNGDTTSTTNAKGQTRTVVINDQGWVSSVTDGQTGTVTNCVATGGTTTTYGYDAFGNATTVQDANGNQIQNKFDTLGRKYDSTDPDMGHWTYSYDQLGELLSQTDAKSQTTSIQYDKLQRPTYRTEADLNTQWLYDTTNGIGKLQAACTPTPANPTSCPLANYQQQPSYDSLSRVSQGKLALDSTTYNYNVTYDPDTGRVASLKYPSGFQADYTYNSYGYLTNIKDDATGNTLWHGVVADAELHLTQQALGSSIAANDGYDPQTGRLLATCATTHTGTCDGNVSNLTYTWDTVGNLTLRADANGPYTERFCYDSFNRLLALAASTLCPGPGGKTYAYDALGNITKKSDVCNTANCFSYGSGAGPHALTSIVGSYNGVTNPTFAYDANGKHALRCGADDDLHVVQHDGVLECGLDQSGLGLRRQSQSH